MSNTIYYTVYKIQNKLNNKEYIGSHKTEDIHDSYMGSGKAIQNAINKYGAEHFEKEILHIFDTADDMYAKEAELVNEDYVKSNNTYNIKVGGTGGFDYINSNGLNGRQYQDVWNKGQSGLQTWTDEQREKYANTWKEKMEEGYIPPSRNRDPWNKGLTGVQTPWNKGKELPKYTCEHCGKTVGGEGNYTRWHGANCKSK